MKTEMRYFDLHCDTLFEMYHKNVGFENEILHISAGQTKEYEDYRQIFAVWSDVKLGADEAYSDFWKILDHAKEKFRDLGEKFPSEKYLLAVEGGALLGEDLDRLDLLYAAGVRVLTLVWGGECPIGGAHNTDHGLTGFGRNAVKHCFELGITPDLSHASDPMIDEVTDMAKKAGKPVIATHSDARSLCDHKRNLTDAQLRGIASTGGLVGINLVRDFLGEGTADRVCDHIFHIAEVCGTDHTAIGCDLDGTSPLPGGIVGLSDVKVIYDKLIRRGMPIGDADSIFYNNAVNFADKWLKIKTPEIR